jgi:hypothetical protein
MNRRFWLLIFLPLALGFLIYLFLRQETILSSFIPVDLQLKNVPQAVNFIASWLPDFLWCFSLCSCLLSYAWIRNNKYAFIFIAGISVLSELIQLFLTAFTFDFFDLGAAFLAVILSYRLKAFS